MTFRPDFQFSDPIQLTAAEYGLAKDLAEATMKVFGGNRGYYRNTSNSHLIGKLGELAAAKWFEEHGYEVERLFEQVGREQRRVEVKTWTAQWWEAWGRCVAVGQLPALANKADFILWTTADAASTPTVVLQGWSTVGDVRQAPVLWTGPEGKQVRNHQLAPSALRPVGQLASPR